MICLRPQGWLALKAVLLSQDTSSPSFLQPWSTCRLSLPRLMFSVGLFDVFLPKPVLCSEWDRGSLACQGLAHSRRSIMM